MIDLSVFREAVDQIAALSEARLNLIQSGGPQAVVAEIDASLEALAMWIHDVREAAMHPPAVQEDPLADQIAI